MPGIEDFDPAEYDPNLRPKPLGAPQAAAAPKPGFDLKQLLSSLPQMQTQALRQGLGAYSGAAQGAAKELGQQATNIDQLRVRLGQFGVPVPAGLSDVQRMLGGVPQGAFTPQGDAEQYGAVAAKVGVPILASATTAGVAAPALATMGTAGRIASTAGLEGLVGGAAGATQGQDIGEQAALGTMFGGVGAALGAGTQAWRAGMAARAARQLRNVGTPTQQVNEALGLIAKDYKGGRETAQAVIDEGIKVFGPDGKTRLPLEAVKTQYKNVLDDLTATKGVLLDQSTKMTDAADIAGVVDESFGRVLTLAKRQGKKALVKDIERLTDFFQNDPVTGAVRDNLTPRDLNDLLTDVRTGIGIKKSYSEDLKGLIRSSVRRAYGKLNEFTDPGVKLYNKRIFDLLPLDDAIERQIAREGSAGIPAHEASKIEKVLSQLPLIGKTPARARSLGRILRILD